jgi:3-oxoacyl-[acyl-carrier protein] reductase
MLLNDRVALVTGSDSGIGQATAIEFGREGADVVVTYRRDATGARATCSDIEGSGRRAIAVQADLADEADVEGLFDRAIEAFGRVDILVNNAGGPPVGPFEAHDLETWRSAIRLNLESALLLTRALLPGMKERGWGRIVNITSVAVKEPVDGLILSNSVRAAVTGFARTLANEVAPYGVTVNNALPGYTRTDRLEELAGALAAQRGVERGEIEDGWCAAIPMGRLGEPAEFAALVAFLASERASYITGRSITVDGGRTRGLL